VPKPDLPDIATNEIYVESAFGAKPIRVLTYRPVTSDAPLPVIVHIHGGGFVMGAPEMKDVENRLFASELRCAIYSVDHRLAPESPHPAPVEDIYSVVAWLHANAEFAAPLNRRPVIELICHVAPPQGRCNRYGSIPVSIA
jgi:acetyl esterase/lipase